MHVDAQIVTLVFTIVTGVGVLLQAGVLLGMFIALRQTQKRVHALTEKIEDHVLPLTVHSRELLTDLTPKIRTITANLVEASATLRSQTEQVKTVVDDISSRTRQQTARVDGIVTSTLNSLQSATSAIERGIAAPLRQVSGVLNGLRAGLETLSGKDARPVAKPAPRASQPPPPQPVAPPVVSTTPVAATPVTPRPFVNASDLTPEEASAAAARFVRDRAAAASDRR